MTDTLGRRRNNAPWWALLLAFVAIACNVGFFVSLPLQGLLTWVSLFFAVVALIFLAIGLKRAFGQPQVYRGKVTTVVLTVVTLLPVGLAGIAFFGARKIPSANAAPQVGQRVPDFTLADTSGKPVSLDQLLAPTSSESVTSSQAKAPKAVLLIFYRGYW